MARKVRARVRAGKLELLEPIDLPEGKELTVSIEETPEQTAADEAFARAAGAWRGLVDADGLIRMLYEARLRPGRGPGA
jgi:predicted DNA-binding antitoxin AbrB/MazE fold protein